MKNKFHLQNKKICFVKIDDFQHGFSMIEIIVYMGIFSILVGILASVFIYILNNQLTSETTASTDQNGKYILSRLTYDIYRAQTITIPASPGTQTNNLQLIINNINYSYNLDPSGNFQIKDITDNLGPYNLNDYDATISALTFKRIGPASGENTVIINFTVISNTKMNKNQSKAFSTTIGMR